jgi:hypothetical protein
MAQHVLERGGRIDKTIRLGDEEVRVCLDSDAAIDGFLRMAGMIDDAEKRLRGLLAGEDRTDALREYGRVIIEMLELVFGEDGAEKLLRFYEGNYIGLSMEAVPFIAGVVVPEMKKAVADRKRRLERYYAGASGA